MSELGKPQFFDATFVRQHLPMSECIDAMARAMVALSDGKIESPPRNIFALADGSGYFGTMPGFCSELGLGGTKILTLKPGNAARGLPAIQGAMLLFDYVSGAPMAVLDGAEITGIRTAAASALATRVLSNASARVLGVLGTGLQAVEHVRAICAVRDIEEIRIWGRDPAKARSFARSVEETQGGIVRAVEKAEHAAQADIVCTVTSASEPVLLGQWLRPGTHVNLVGSHSATARECDTEGIARARVYVDSREFALLQAGELVIPIREGAIDASHIVGEIGECLRGRVPGRRSADEITLYKSLGVIAQDLFAAQIVLEHARRPDR